MSRTLSGPLVESVDWDKITRASEAKRRKIRLAGLRIAYKTQIPCADECIWIPMRHYPLRSKKLKLAGLKITWKH